MIFKHRLLESVKIGTSLGRAGCAIAVIVGITWNATCYAVRMRDDQLSSPSESDANDPILADSDADLEAGLQEVD